MLQVVATAGQSSSCQTLWTSTPGERPQQRGVQLRGMLLAQVPKSLDLHQGVGARRVAWKTGDPVVLVLMWLLVRVWLPGTHLCRPVIILICLILLACIEQWYSAACICKWV
jgi:hypothetical protein